MTRNFPAKRQSSYPDVVCDESLTTQACAKCFVRTGDGRINQGERHRHWIEDFADTNAFREHVRDSVYDKTDEARGSLNAACAWFVSRKVIDRTLDSFQRRTAEHEKPVSIPVAAPLFEESNITLCE